MDTDAPAETHPPHGDQSGRILARVGEPVFVVDTECGEICDTNAAGERLRGQSRTELVGLDHTALHPVEDADAYRTLLERSATTGETRTRLQDGSQAVVVTATGDHVPVEITAEAIELPDGPVSYFVYRTRSERPGEKRRTERFEAIFDQTVQFMCLLDPDGTVVDINESAREFGSLDSTSIVGTSFAELPLWRHSERAAARIRDAVDRAANGAFEQFETTASGAGGIATLDFSMKPVTDETGTVTLLIVEGRDVTARNRQREYMQIMQRVLRHNMRNDLQKVGSYVELMRSEPDRETREEYASIVASVLGTWTTMTEKLRNVQGILERQARNRETTDSATVLRRAVATARDAHPTVTVTLTGSPIESGQVPVGTGFVLTELLENAIAASQPPGASVEVLVSQSSSAWTEMIVVDDGPGMPAMEADVLETGEVTPLHHGEGIGLWIVRLIVSQVGGTVSVEVTDHGTAVSVRMPIAES